MSKEFISSIIWDSGASLSITNDKMVFHGTLKPCPYKHLKVKGVAQAIKAHGQGTVLWSVLDEAGMLRTLKVPALYIPDAKVKVLSVNSSGDVYPEETVTFHPQGATCLVTPPEGELTSQETLQTTFQLHTPMSIKGLTKHPVTWPALSQSFITPISTSVQPKRNFYNGTTDWATWASRKFNFI